MARWSTIAVKRRRLPEEHALPTMWRRGPLSNTLMIKAREQGEETMSGAVCDRRWPRPMVPKPEEGNLMNIGMTYAHAMMKWNGLSMILYNRDHLVIYDFIIYPCS
jgi:hypothetical protein